MTKKCYLLIFVVSIIWHGNSLADVTGEKITFLFEHLPANESILDTPSTLEAGILRSLITLPLVRSSQNLSKGFEHVLTDALSRASNDMKISLRLHRGISFSNGGEVHVRDVISSLNRCWGKDEALKKILFHGRNTFLSDDYREVWIDFNLPEGMTYGSFIDSVSKCPILDYKNSVIFGSSLGVGSNIIAAGEFAIWSYRSGKSYSLGRSGIFLDRKGAKQIDLVTYSTPQKGLTTVRSGAADAMVTADKEVLVTARTDPTLEVITCKDMWLVKRKGLSFNCYDFVDSNVGYAS